MGLKVCGLYGALGVALAGVYIGRPLEHAREKGEESGVIAAGL